MPTTSVITDELPANTQTIEDKSTLGMLSMFEKYSPSLIGEGPPDHFKLKNAIESYRKQLGDAATLEVSRVDKELLQ